MPRQNDAAVFFISAQRQRAACTIKVRFQDAETARQVLRLCYNLVDIEYRIGYDEDRI